MKGKTGFIRTIVFYETKCRKNNDNNPREKIRF